MWPYTLVDHSLVFPNINTFYKEIAILEIKKKYFKFFSCNYWPVENTFRTFSAPIATPEAIREITKIKTLNHFCKSIEILIWGQPFVEGGHKNSDCLAHALLWWAIWTWVSHLLSLEFHVYLCTIMWLKWMSSEITRNFNILLLLVFIWGPHLDSICTVAPHGAE